MKPKFTFTLFSVIFFSFFAFTNSGIANSGETFCFNANLSVEEQAMIADDCNTAPNMDCASTYFGCPNDSIDPSNTGFTIATPGDEFCPEPELTYQDEVMVDTGCELTIKRVWTATYPDNASPWLFSTCTQMLFLTDDAPTVTNCPADITIDLSTNGCDFTATWDLPTWDDDCGFQSITSTMLPGSTFPLGTTTVSYLGLDFCGNSATCEFTVTVIGTCCEGNPTITCPADYTACPGTTTSPTVTGTAISISGDECDPAEIAFNDVTVNDDICNTVIERTWTATYPGTTQSSSCTQILTYSDNSNPTLSGIPTDINLTASGVNCSAVATWTLPTMGDNCGGGTLTSTHNSGSTFDEGTTTVTYTATDACGNSISGSFTVTVTCDCSTVPIITCPSDYTDCPGSSTDPATTGSATADAGSTLCDTPIVDFIDVITSPMNSCGETTIERTWTATDPNDALLFSSCTQVITLVDDIAPTFLTTVENITLTAPLSDCTAVANWTEPTTSDNCGAVVLTSTASNGSAFTEGTTTVTYTATDDCGNAITTTFTVTVTCTCDIPPTILCPVDIIDCPGASISPTVTGTATGTNVDGCGNVLITFNDEVTVPANDCGETTIVRTWTATDSNNASLFSTCNQTITHIDDQAPVIVDIPDEILMTLTGSGCSTIVTWTIPTTTDNCTAVELTSTHESGETFSEGTTTVVYTATDACGNSATDSFDVTVECLCGLPPVISCPINYFGCINDSTDPSNTGEPTVTTEPGCGDNIDVTFSDSFIQNTSCVSEIVRTFTATDLDNGQSATCTQFLGLYDMQFPTFESGPSDISLTSAGLGCTAVATWTEPVVTDECGLDSVTSTHSSGDTFNEGTTTVVYTAVDECGKTTTYAFTVTVECTCTDPIQVTCPTNYFGCIGSTDPSITGTPTFIENDGCGPYELTSVDMTITDTACAVEIVRIWTITDLGSGTNAVCPQFIGLYDQELPTISDVPDDIIVEGIGKGCNELVEWTPPVAADDCGIASFTSTHNPGDSFAEGTTTVVYTAVDNCGKTTSITFNVTVECTCEGTPLLQCPINYFGCIGDDLSPASIGTPTFNEVDGCGPIELEFADGVITDNGCIYEAVRTWTSLDLSNGNSATCTQFIGLYDMSDPMIANVPNDIVFESSGSNCSASITWTEPTATDNCGEVTLTSNFTSGSEFFEGTTAVVYTAVDGCGRTTTASFNVTVNCVCNTPPSIVCPADYMACPGSDIDTAITGTATATADDGCDTPIVTFIDAEVINGCNTTITRTWTATDPSDATLTASCNQIISLTDTEAPAIINCPHDVTIDGAGVCEKPFLWFEPTATDNCGTATLTSNIENGATFSEGSTEVIYTASDDCGNTSICSFSVTIICDGCETPPSIVCPSDITVCIGDDMMPTNTGTATATQSNSDCTGIPTVSFTDVMISNGPCAGALVIERTWTATDPETDLSSSCTQMVVAEDIAAPVITNVPEDIFVTAPASDCFVEVTWVEPTVTDNCTSVTTTSNFESGDTFGEAGTYTVTYTAVDACNNTTTASFTVSVSCECDEVPALTCPSDYTACPGSSIDPSVTGTAIAIPGWACSDPTVTFSDNVIVPANTCGETTIHRVWTATDTFDTSLTTSCTQVITLADDGSAPIILNIPEDIAVTAPASDCFVAVTWVAPTATDGCGAVTLTSDFNSGDTFGEDGTYPVTYTATDACGNSSTASFNVIVTCECDEVPVLSCPSDYTACPGSSIDPSVTGTATAIPGWACNAPTVTFSDNVIVPANTCGETTIHRTWTATDTFDESLATSCTQVITLADDGSAPVFSNVPGDIEVSAPASDCFVAVNWLDPVATDGCGMVTLTSNFNSGDTFGEAGTYTVTYTATDACGNSSTASFNVIVTCECDEVPVLSCPSDYTACPGSSIDPSITGTATAIPGWACNAPTVTFSDNVIVPANTCGETTIHRIWTATDTFDESLATSCTQVITLIDGLAPTIYGIPLDISLDGGDGPDCSAIYSWATPTATDNCSSSVVVTSDIPSGSEFSTGVTVVTLTASDACGNVASATFEVNVLCTTGSNCMSMPTITCPADFSGCAGSSFAPSTTGYAVATAGPGDCLDPNVTYDDVITVGSCSTSKIIERTWTATDPFNSAIFATCVQTITLDDTQGPTILGCPSDISVVGTVACDAIVNWTPPTATDNCSAVTLTSNINSGTAFWEGTTEVIYTATDGCGNTSTCSFNVTVTCPDPICSTPPSLTCPGDAVLCIGSSISPSILGQPIVLGSAECPTPSVTFTDYILSTGPCAGAKVIDRVWKATYPGTGLDATCTQSIIIKDDLKPVIQNCPANIVVDNQMTMVTWQAPTVIDNCGVDSFTSTHFSGTYYPVGVTTVVYTAVDNCGNTEYCSFTVTVQDNMANPPVCPDDIVVGCDGNGGAYVTFDPPIYDEGCSPCTGEYIPGFIYMGSYEGHQYYCSNSPATWLSAQAVATSNGGYLAVINDAGENAFLANILTIQSAYIGLSDHLSEGNFEWVNGEPLTYTNWYAGQPNDFNYNQDYVEMLNNGEWNDQYSYSQLEYIMEVPCSGVVQTAGPSSGSYLSTGTYTVEYTVADGCNDGATCTFDIVVEAAISIDCPEDVTLSNGYNNAVVNWETPSATTCCTDVASGGPIPGYIYMGSYNGHYYYCSTEPSTWPNANAACDTYGGYLAVINDEDENAFLADILTIQSAFIGLSDHVNEGQFQWTNGDPLTYTNWYAGQPNNYNDNQDYCEMLSDGTWNDQYNYKELEYIMEVPGSLTVTQTAGPSSGSVFTAGTTTTISYIASDACGNVEECSFNITLEGGDACVSSGENSSQVWANSIDFSDLWYESGNNGGYANLMEVADCASVIQGNSYLLSLEPGYAANYTTTVYWSAWIDYNMDGDFTDANEFIAYGSGDQTLTGVITMPSVLWTGKTTMRVIMKTGGYATSPCESYNYGETEDYCIGITGGDFAPDENTVENRNTGLSPIQLEGSIADLTTPRLETYPSPASSFVNFNLLEVSDVNDVLEASIYDLQGRRLSDIQFDHSLHTSYDVSAMDDGMYIIKVVTRNSKVVSERFVVKH